jgi:predicted nucleic acid-binding protein
MLIDSSAWIEYLRRTGSWQNVAVRAALAANDAHTLDTVRLELLCGVASEALVHNVVRLLDRCTDLELLPGQDVESAGQLYRACRRGGETIRRANDCLIAAVAIRYEIPVLHRDADFDAIARHSPLRLVRP